MKPQAFPLLLFTFLFSFFAFSGLAIAQNGSHLDVDHDATYGEEPQEQTGDPVLSEDQPEAADSEALQQSDEILIVERPQPPTWTGVLARNTVAGGITGGLIGLGIWLLTDMGLSPWTVAQFAGGGILIGAAVGVVEVITRPDRYALGPPSSTVWVKQDAPRALMMPFLRLDF